MASPLAAAQTPTAFAAHIVERARQLRSTVTQPLRLLLPSGSEANVQPVIERFSTATGIDMVVENVAVDDVNTKLLLAVASGEPIDVALPATYGIPDLVEAGALHPLNDVDVGFDLKNETRSLFTLGDYYNQRRYGLQTDGDVYVMFYNRRLLEDPALAEAFERLYGERPAPAKTWPELDRLIRFYHAPDRGRFGGTLFRTPGYVAWEWWIRFHAKGQLPFDEAMRPQVASRHGVEALEELAEVTSYLHPESRTAGLVDNWALFSRGDSLCSIGWGGSQKYFRSHGSGRADDIIVAPTPGGVINGKPVDFSYFNWGWNYAVPSTSTHPQLAALFAFYAASPEVSTVAVRAVGGFFDPFHAEHYADPEIVRVYGEPFLEVHQRSMNRAIPDLYLRGRDEYFAILDEYLRRAVQREIAPSEALDIVSRLWDRVTDDLGRSGQSKQWLLLKNRYPDTVWT